MAGEFKFRIGQIKQVLDPAKMADGAYRIFLANTPVRSGNARRKTELRKDEINAKYPYATRLDNGYSKQRPAGMVKPTMAWLKDYIKRNLGK